MSLPSPSDAVEIRARHFAGLFLLSLATLLLELALTRILSVSLWYHFGFLVISTALLGFGVSGVTLALWADLRERKDLDLALGICGLAFAVCVVFSFWCLQRIPFDPFSVAVDHRQFLFMPIYFLLVALPFFCSGLGISLLLTRGSKEINRLYGYDLLGAGVGCALVALVIPRFGGTGSVFGGSVRWGVICGVFCLGLPACSCNGRTCFAGLSGGELLRRKTHPHPCECKQAQHKHQCHLFSLEYDVAGTSRGIFTGR